MDSASITSRFALLSAGVWLYAADTFVSVTLSPDMVADIGGVAYVSWVVSLYEAGGLVAGVATAMLCVLAGIKRVFCAAGLIYAVGCAVTAAAPNMLTVIVGRAVQGLGGGIFLSLASFAASKWFTEATRGRLFSTEAFVWVAGSLLGPSIGGLFASLASWRGAFAFFGLQGAAVSIFALGLPRDAPTHVDRPPTMRLFPRDLLNLRRPVGAGLSMVLALSMSTVGFAIYGPLILKTLFGTRPVVTGYIVAGEALAWSLATFLMAATGPHADGWPIRGGACLIGLGTASLAVAVPAGVMQAIIVFALLQGAGFGLCWPATFNRLLRSCSPSERDVVSTAQSMMQRIGYAVGTATAGAVANVSGLGAGMSVSGAKAAGFWVFAAFIPLLALALIGAWRFTAGPPE